MSSSAQPASSTQPTSGGGTVSSIPTLTAYPVLESLYTTLQSYLNLSLPIPTDSATREALFLQIFCKLEVLTAAATDLRVGTNKDLIAFRRGLSYILGQIQPDTVTKYKFSWPWLVSSPTQMAFHGFHHDRDGNPTPNPAIAQPPPSPPRPKPVPVVRPSPSLNRTVAFTRPPKPPRVLAPEDIIHPAQIEGLYRIPTPASDCSDRYPFGVVPGWIPQLPSFLLEHWSRKTSDQQPKDLPEPYPHELRDPDYEDNKTPPPKTSGSKGKAKAVPRPLVWLHESKEPLPANLPGQEKSFNDLGEELPCPNAFREYLLPDERRTFSIANRPQSILAPTHLLPPFGLKPRSDTKRKHKSDAHPKVTPPQKLPVYDKGPLFKQGKLLAELSAPLPTLSSPPQWVRPPCGNCAAQGIDCTGGDFLHGVRCDNCNVLKQPCGFDIAIPRLTSLSAMSAAADASPERISSLIVDSLMLRGMAQVAYALAEDQYKLLESKVGTLSLVLRRVYSAEGDTGLRRYFTDIEPLRDLLEFSRFVDLDTPMLYPRRTSSTAIEVGSTKFEWTTVFEKNEVDAYLTDLRSSFRASAIPTTMDVDQPITIVSDSGSPPPPLPSRPPPMLSVKQVREPTPLFLKKRGRVEIESEEEESEAESAANIEAEEDPAEGEPTPPLSPKAGPSTIKPVPTPVTKYNRHPFIQPSPFFKPAGKKASKKWEKLQSQAKKPRK